MKPVSRGACIIIGLQCDAPKYTRHKKERRVCRVRLLITIYPVVRLHARRRISFAWLQSLGTVKIVRYVQFEEGNSREIAPGNDRCLGSHRNIVVGTISTREITDACFPNAASTLESANVRQSDEPIFDVQNIFSLHPILRLQVAYAAEFSGPTCDELHVWAF
nr:hypothetical protein [Caballeronia sp. SL2Y3]